MYNIKIPFLWVKLNVYSLLILALIGIATAFFFYFDILHNATWKKIVFVIAALIPLNKALFIIRQYSHKKSIMQRLISTCRERGYKPRLFMGYMDSLCMQRMVYLTLIELDMAYEYGNLKILKKEPFKNRSKAVPPVAYYEFKNGKMEFVYIEQQEDGE